MSNPELAELEGADSLEIITDTVDPVVQETINTHEHVTTSTKLETETHTHHYQHRVLPVEEIEHLPEEHIIRFQQPVNKESVMNLSSKHEKYLEKQHSKVKPSQERKEAIETEETVEPIEKETLHHHVHEYVTPVLKKQTHRHKIIHNITPIRQTVWEEPIIYGVSLLPTLSLLEFEALVGQEIPGQELARSQEMDLRSTSSVDDAQRAELDALLQTAVSCTLP